MSGDGLGLVEERNELWYDCSILTDPVVRLLMKSLADIQKVHHRSTLPGTPEPAWEVALLFPPQGRWSEEDYLALETNRLVEYNNGSIEVLPMPTLTHQRIVLAFIKLLLAYLSEHPVGEFFPAPVRLRLREGRYREPDLVFVSDIHASWKHEQYLSGADWVLEVVSPDDPARDYVVKRREYAEAGVPEYWIVDPEKMLILVLTLADEGVYREAGVFRPGETAVSSVLDGFRVAVSQALLQDQK